MYLSKKYKLKEWGSYNDDIYYSSKDFFKEKGFIPNIVAFNKHTYEQICFFTTISPERKFIKNDDGEGEIEISRFCYEEYSYDPKDECHLYILHCVYIEKLKDKEFEIIYDDDADFDDDEKTPIDNPVFKKEIVHV
jgi:hypothetical protein